MSEKYEIFFDKKEILGVITVRAVLQHLWSLQLSCYLSGEDKADHKVHCPPLKWELSCLIKTFTSIKGSNQQRRIDIARFECFGGSGANRTVQKANGLRSHNSLHVKSKLGENTCKTLHIQTNGVF